MLSTQASDACANFYPAALHMRMTECPVVHRQEALGQLGREFDGIFFDTYSEYYEDMRCAAARCTIAGFCTAAIVLHAGKPVHHSASWIKTCHAV